LASSAFYERSRVSSSRGANLPPNGLWQAQPGFGRIVTLAIALSIACLEHRRELLRRWLDRRSKKATRKRSPQKSITVVFGPPASSGKLGQSLGVGSIR